MRSLLYKILYSNDWTKSFLLSREWSVLFKDQGTSYKPQFSNLCILASWSKTPAVQQLRIDWKIGLVTDTWGQRGIIQDKKAAGVAEKQPPLKIQDKFT